jgi:hypothetical protein
MDIRSHIAWGFDNGPASAEARIALRFDNFALDASSLLMVGYTGTIHAHRG